MAIPNEFQAEDAEQVLAEFWREMAEGNLEPALRETLPILHRGQEQNFLDAVDSSGAAWPARKDSKPHPLLILSGLLIESVRDTGGEGHFDQFSPREYSTGVRGEVVPYASLHDEGAGNLPQREFMYASTETQAKMLKAFADQCYVILVG